MATPFLLKASAATQMFSNVSKTSLVRSLLTWKGENVVPSAVKRAPANLRALDFIERRGFVKGMVTEVRDDPGREANLCRVKFTYPFNREEFFVQVKGVTEGSEIYCGSNAPVSPGNVLPLRVIPIGTEISTVEIRPGDRGKLCRASGTRAVVLSHNFKENTTKVRLQSKKEKVLKNECRAVIGRIFDMPREILGKAGRAFHRARAKGKKYPHVRGVAKNPVDHPHGGGSHGHIRCVSHDTPPGRKFGYLAARRTGRKRS